MGYGYVRNMEYRREGLEIDQNIYRILEYDKGGNLIQWRKDDFCVLKRVLFFLQSLCYRFLML